MKTNCIASWSTVLLLNCGLCHAVDRYVSLEGGHVGSFTSWAAAATNIQAAIDVASAGDLIWVTNGVYASGGKVMAGDLTNRVALDKALTVQSVNGPLVTVIKGLGAISGNTAVRCAWLTNGATLKGFTVRDGATRAVGDDATLRSGGGVWSASSNATVANCMIISNTATFGGGVYHGTVRNCFLNGNKATPPGAGGGSYFAGLINCTVTSNSFVGFYGGNATNCIMYFNSPGNWSPATGSKFSHCCTTNSPNPSPPPGIGNFMADPQLIDGIHLANTSPCRAAGTNLVTGTDLDGQPWANPPSIGCEEWHPQLLLVNPPQVRFSNDLSGFSLSVIVAGEEPICYWTRDGVPIEDDGHYSSAHTTNLVANEVKPFDVGAYQVVVSNGFGMVTSAVIQLPIRCVDVAGNGPVPPYSSWATSATNIQDAIDAASIGDVIWVTNGIYASGGKVKAGDLTNRVALDKALTVRSVNGPNVTTIQGQWDSATTNGPGAVRCVWLTNGATLNGFTIQGGATRTNGDSGTLQNGGGVWCSNSAGVVINCLIVNNSAAYDGGGAFAGSYYNCRLSGNATTHNGGGVNGGILKNCAIIGNVGKSMGGGCGGGSAFSVLNNCTITGNSVQTFAGGSYSDKLTNCIVYHNSTANPFFYGDYSNSLSSVLVNTCSSPFISGIANTNVDPQFLADGLHLSPNSPCRGAGNSAVVSGTDIDGQTWAGPPSMGCDEWHPEPVIIVQPSPRPATGSGQARMTASATGQEPFYCFWRKDGSPVEDGPHYASAHSTSLLIGGFGLGDAGSYQVVVSNSVGMVTSQVAQVSVHCVDALNVSPAAPYTTWGTAASTIQDAIEAAAPNDVVVVTNGVYATGGKVKSGDLTNRVAVGKAILVTSVNGPGVTIIQGQWDPTTTTGPGAVRCAWLADDAGLSGFTIQGGATRQSGESSGGGVWCNSSKAEVANCVISNNAAASIGGGVYFGTLNSCTLVGNSSGFTLGIGSGGGAYGSELNRCVITQNSSRLDGGGVYGCVLYNSWLSGNSALRFGGGSVSSVMKNCTLTGNSAVSGRGGSDGGWLTNCIVYFNSVTSPTSTTANLGSAKAAYSCSSPLQPGAGNISDDPQLIDGLHLAVTSPCRGMGSSLYAVGADIDGEPWANPPSMGCDEVLESALVGPLSVSLTAAYSEVAVYRTLPLTGQVLGRATRLEWSFGDGPIFTNLSYLTSHSWTNAGDYTVTFTAFNTDNPGGVSTNLLMHVAALLPPALSVGGLSNTTFRLSFAGQPGVTYVVEQATNLSPPVTWQTVQTLASTGTLMQATDTKATNAMRFYRARTL